MKPSLTKSAAPGFFQRAWIVVAATLGAAFLRFVDVSTRWELRGLFKDAELWKRGKPVLVVFWHGRQLMMSSVYRRSGMLVGSAGMYALISRHRDGRIVGLATKFLGIRTVAGSSTRGGTEAGLELVHKLKEGFDVAMTPDGPRGPEFKVKPGVLRIAQMSGAQLYPAAAASTRAHCFSRSWDHMMLPLPFGKVYAIAGEGLQVPSDATAEDLDTIGQELERRLNLLTKEVDALCGR